jgi:Domain of unknown function (DUF4252)
MKLRLAVCLLALGLAPTLMAHDAALDIPDFKPLEHRAIESVNITLGPWLLHTAAHLVDKDDPDSATIQGLLKSLTSVRIRSFEFSSDGAYSKEDVDSVRRQLTGPGWTQLVQVHDRKQGEDVDVYMSIVDDHTNGFALIASEPRQFTIVNVVGSIRLEDIPKIQKQLNLPKMHYGNDAPEARIPAAQL